MILQPVLGTGSPLALGGSTGFGAAAELEMPRIKRALVNAEVSRTLGPRHEHFRPRRGREPTPPRHVLVEAGKLGPQANFAGWHLIGHNLPSLQPCWDLISPTPMLLEQLPPTLALGIGPALDLYHTVPEQEVHDQDWEPGYICG